jgi:cytochrome c
MRYFGWAHIEYRRDKRLSAEPDTACQRPHSRRTPRRQWPAAFVPLRDKHVFDTHVFAAGRGRRQNGPSSEQIEGGPRKPLSSTRISGFIRGIPVFLWPFVSAGSDSAMDANAYRINKVLGLVLGTALFLQAVHIIDGNFTTRVAKPGSEVAAKVAQPQAGAAAPVPIDTLLASASAERGAQVAKQCQACHNFEEGQGPKIGPDLYGVVGRKIASAPGFNYSSALKSKNGNWDFAALSAWLTKPTAYAPGTAMTFAGLSNDKQRADVIAYLDTLSTNPVPLPKAQ